MQIDGVREAQVEWRRQSELLADADAQGPAVYENGAMTRAGPLEHEFDRRVLYGIAMHRGKQARHANAGKCFGIPGARVHHRPRKEAVRMTVNGGAYRILIAGQARDERGAVDSVSVEFTGPSLG